jgi:stage II sporulation protein D
MIKILINKKLYFIFFIIILNCTNIFCDINDVNKLWWNGDFSAAEESYKNEIKENKKNIQSYLQLASLYKSIGQYQKAISIYQKAISLEDKKENFVSIYNSLGECFYCLSNYKKGLKFFNKALDNVISSEEACFEERNLSLKQEERSLTHKGFGMTEGFYIYFNLGRTLFYMNKFDKSIEMFLKAIEINPDFAGTYFYLGEIYKQKNDLEKSIENYKKVLSKDVYFVEARTLLAEDYRQKELFDKAYEQLYKVKLVDTDNMLLAKAIDDIKQNLTQKEEEIIPPKKQKDFYAFRKVEKVKGIPEIRIGINSNSSGKVNEVLSVSFRSNKLFSFYILGKKKIISKENSKYTITLKNGVVNIFENDLEIVSGIKNSITIYSKGKNNSFIIDSLNIAKGNPWSAVEDRQYRGKLEFSITDKGIKIVNIVNTEEYLYSVIAGEMMPNWPIESLKAQAVIARSYLFYKTKYSEHLKDGYDICDDQHCQVYGGVGEETSNTNNAVDQTRGEILTCNGKVINALYYSSCGGHTQGSSEVFGWGDEQYLKGVFDGNDDNIFPSSSSELEYWLKSKPKAYCNQEFLKYPQGFRWVRIIPIEIMNEKINRYKKIENIKEIICIGRSSAGNVKKVIIRGELEDLIIEKENLIRRLLGLGSLRSTLFWIETHFDKKNNPIEFTVYGGGWGHGIGLCQSGAAGMAIEGYSYKEILSHYYKDTILEKKY